MDGKEGTSDRCGVVTEHDEVVHLQKIAGGDANHVFDFGVPFAGWGLAHGLHVALPESALICDIFSTESLLGDVKENQIQVS